MKTGKDPRHLKRKKLLEKLFEWQFRRANIKRADPLIFPIIKEIETIDQTISRCAPEFPIDKINPVDLSILRLAIYEITLLKESPVKVIIDEAIELAKEYGGETSPAFINGALGTAIKND